MIESVNIGGVQYNVPQAPAMLQKKLLLRIGTRIALAANAKDEKQVDSIALVGTLLGLDESTFDEVANIVLNNVRKNGEPDTIVDVQSFQGKMTDYFKLIAECIVINLNDYFTWLASEKAGGAQASKKTKG